MASRRVDCARHNTGRGGVGASGGIPSWPTAYKNRAYGERGKLGGDVEGMIDVEG